MVTDTPPPEEPRFEGYQPREPVQARPRPANGAGSRRGPRRVGVGVATLVAVTAFGLGAVLGWIGRGGPADPVLVTTNQDVPAVTVTQEIIP